MDSEHTDQSNEENMEKLDELIQKKKEEIAGLQRLLLSIENPVLPETNQLSEPNEKDIDNKTSE